MSFFKNLLLNISLILTLALGLYGSIKPITLEYDLGRHLLFGKIMIQTNAVIKTNLLSYTNTDFEYVNSHWLFEIGAYILNNILGTNGLIFLTASIYFLTFLILFRFVYFRVALSAIALTLPILISFFVVFRIDIRPEIFSYLFTSIFIIILYKFREKYTKVIFILIPISLLWVNLHIYFSIGLFLIFLFLAEELILNKLKINRKIKTLAIILVFSFLVSLINPNFIKGVLFPITVFNNYGIAIQENLSLLSLAKENIHITFLPHLILIIVSFFLLFFYRKKSNLIDKALIILFGIFAIIVSRNFYIFMIVSFFAFSKLISFLLIDIERILSKFVNKYQLEVLKILGFFYLCIMIILLLIFQVYVKDGFGLNTVERGKSALDFYKQNNLKGPIYNSFDIGQYIAHRLYPNELVFVDGRPEAYPKNFLKYSYDLPSNNTELFEKLDSDYKFNAFIIQLLFFKNQPEIEYLLKNDRFKLIYIDTYIMIFVRDNEENQELINKYKINEDNFKLKGNEDIFTISKYVLLFDQINWRKAENKVYKNLLKKEGGACGLKTIMEKDPSNNKELMNIKILPSDRCD